MERPERNLRQFAGYYPREAAFLLMYQGRSRFMRGVREYVEKKGFASSKQLDCVRDHMARAGAWGPDGVLPKGNVYVLVDNEQHERTLGVFATYEDAETARIQVGRKWRRKGCKGFQIDEWTIGAAGW